MADGCTCGRKFRDAEDYRDHLPCLGTKAEQEIARLRVERDENWAKYATAIERVNAAYAEAGKFERERNEARAALRRIVAGSLTEGRVFPTTCRYCGGFVKLGEPGQPLRHFDACPATAARKALGEE